MERNLVNIIALRMISVFGLRVWTAWVMLNAQHSTLNLNISFSTEQVSIAIAYGSSFIASCIPVHCTLYMGHGAWDRRPATGRKTIRLRMLRHKMRAFENIFFSHFHWISMTNNLQHTKITIIIILLYTMDTGIWHTHNIGDYIVILDHKNDSVHITDYYYIVYIIIIVLWMRNNTIWYLLW